ncbi:MAG: hypothetical protein HYX85_02210 [Chloroflexi bacterium]|nr:hypothetical protein [Chloroflexota bacterium]
MPGKSRHKKGRRLPQGARGRATPVQPAAVTAEAPEMVRPAAPSSRPRASGPQAGTPATSPAAPAPAYIGRELRAIIILGGIMLVVLIVASSLLR